MHGPCSRLRLPNSIALVRPPASFHRIAYDLRGHGASDKPLDADRYTTSSFWADDLAAVIQTHNLERPVLVGWSYGGYVIADYVRKFGDAALGGLVFVGVSTKPARLTRRVFWLTKSSRFSVTSCRPTCAPV
jgi:pimeloyl-ACP methyl ester carboxylesterase